MANDDRASVPRGWGRATPRRGLLFGAATLVGLCVLLTLALRAPFVLGPLLPDEAGMLMVAQHWGDGPYLYGRYWVDRPVLLVLLFRVADVLPGSDLGVRLMGCVCAAVLVACAGWAGHRIRGRRGAGWAALAAAPLASTYFFAADGFNGKLAAATLVTSACACTLAALAGRSALVQVLLGLLAGTLAGGALLVQQSFGGALAFASVSLLGSWYVGAVARTVAQRVLGAGVVGVFVPFLGVLVWTAVSPATWSRFWFVTFAYRFEASAVITDSDMAAEQERMVQVAWLVLLSGAAFLLVTLLLGHAAVWRDRRLRPLLLGIDAMVAVAVVSMVLGGSWWRDYPIQLVPGLALAAALLAPTSATIGRVMRGSVVFAVGAGVAATGVGVANTIVGAPTTETALGRWLAASKQPGDTAVVTYGNADVLHAAEMLSPYPHLWSLPMRTLDPDQAGLRATLSGEDAPTWIVEWTPFNAWEIDDDAELTSLVHDRYEYVGSPCGRDVYLLRTASRDVVPVATCSPGPSWDIVPAVRDWLGPGATPQT